VLPSRPTLRRNFNKVLIDRTGKPVARFGASQDPKGIADEVEKLL